MDRLPLEVLQLVCDYLPSSDLVNVRPVGRNFSQAGANNLFRDIHVMLSKKSFENLTSISEIPALAKYVRNVVYEVRFLAVYMREEAWRRLFVREHRSVDGTNSLSGSVRAQRCARRNNIEEKLQRGWKIFN